MSTPSDATYVLVHGAWHGGWCWRRLTALLRARGDAVHAPTLTGLGDRKHLLHAGIDLETHVTDVTAFLEMEDLTDVVLVGHSYGGMVISGAAERASPRIRRLVYLDALVPSNGQSGFDLNTQAIREQLEADARNGPDGFSMSPPPIEYLGLTAPDDIQWVQSRLARHPVATFQQPVTIGEKAAALPKTFIHCTQFMLQQTAERCRQMGWPVLEMATGHDPMITHPGELAQTLLSPDCR